MYNFEELRHMGKRSEWIGMKAESLVQLLAGGFRVPNGFVVTTKEVLNFTDEELKKYADDTISYAVRSSGTSEDLKGASFAGQYDTYLNVKGLSSLRTAIEKCADSLHNKRVAAYAQSNQLDIDTCKMAVIVQQMIQSEKSGVAFSIDSVNGLDKEVIMEAIHGLGEELVSGHVTPDYYSYNWYEERFTTYHGGVLTRNEVKKLAEVVLQIQIYYGFPVDVEWAMTGSDIYILQSRPITTISYKAMDQEWTTANFRDGGVSSSVCKPITASLYGMVFHPSFIHSVKTIKMMAKDENPTLYDTFFSRPYWCLSAEKECFSKLPGFVERELDEDMGVTISYSGDGMVTKTNIKTIWKGIQVLYEANKYIKFMESKVEEYRKDFLKRIAKMEREDFEKKSTEELYSILMNFIRNDYYDSQYTYFSYIFCNMVLSTFFRDKMKKYLSANEIMNLMSGLTYVSHMRPIYEMWDMSRKIFTDKEFDEFIKRYKHRSHHELDVSYPNWDETKEVVRDMIADFAKMKDNQSPKEAAERQKQKYLNTLAKLPIRWYKDVEQMRRFLWWREEFRDISSKYYYFIRKLMLLLGNAYEKDHVLDQAEDIFFLTVEDMEKMIDLKEKVSRNKKYYFSFANFNNPNEMGSRHVVRRTQKNGIQILKGVPCSGDTITGTARVILDISDAGKLKYGDILVTKATDTAWTAVFSKLSGVITETGGMLSHAAVVSREYGIACILVVKNAVDIIQDGDIITMDCKTGEISKQKMIKINSLL